MLPTSNCPSLSHEIDHHILRWLGDEVSPLRRENGGARDEIYLKSQLRKNILCFYVSGSCERASSGCLLEKPSNRRIGKDRIQLTFMDKSAGGKIHNWLLFELTEKPLPGCGYPFGVRACETK